MSDFEKGDTVKTLSPHIEPRLTGTVTRVCKNTVYVKWENGWYGSWPKDLVARME